LGGAGHVYDLDYGDGFTVVYIGPGSPSDTLNVQFKDTSFSIHIPPLMYLETQISRKNNVYKCFPTTHVKSQPPTTN
jgi:hypothetical protein